MTDTERERLDELRLARDKSAVVLEWAWDAYLKASRENREAWDAIHAELTRQAEPKP